MKTFFALVFAVTIFVGTAPAFFPGQPPSGGGESGGAITELHPGAIGGTLALLICGILMLVDRRRAR
jgi:hypothetical protein